MAANDRGQGERARFALARLTPADLDQVLAVEVRAFSLPWERRLFLAALAAPEYQAWAALDARRGDRAVAGYVILVEDAATVRVAHLAVAEPYRRQGAARLLMAAVQGWAVRRGLTRIGLEVRETNQAARRLYAGLGFTERARLAGYYPDSGEAALVLELDVDPAKPKSR